MGNAAAAMNKHRASNTCSFSMSGILGALLEPFERTLPAAPSASESASPDSPSDSGPSSHSAAVGSLPGSPRSKVVEVPSIEDLSYKASSFSFSKVPVVDVSTQYSLRSCSYLSRLGGNICFFGANETSQNEMDMTNNWKGFNWPDVGLHPGLVGAIGTRSLDSLPWHRDGK